MFKQSISGHSLRKCLALLKKEKILNKAQLTYLKEIAVTKVLSIILRGTKKDFIDLYCILAVGGQFTLAEILKFYNEKFGKLTGNIAHIIESLAYFADAEETKMPKGFSLSIWREVKKFFEKETSALMKSLIIK